MTRVEDRLSEMLHQAAAPSALGVSFEEVAHRARRRRVVRATVSAAVVAATVIAAVGIVTFGPGSRVTGSGPASSVPARHTGGVLNPIGWNGNLYPLGPPGLTGALKTTVAGAQAKAGYPVPVPSTPAASRASLTQVWVNTHNSEVALVFDKGKVDITMHRATYQGALRYFRAFVVQKNKNGAPNAAIGQVDGRPALVIPPPPNRSDVMFYRNGIFISISSNRYGTHTLLAIARSMR
jgi:hypothetical protein